MVLHDEEIGTVEGDTSTRKWGIVGARVAGVLGLLLVVSLMAVSASSGLSVSACTPCHGSRVSALAGSDAHGDVLCASCHTSFPGILALAGAAHVVEGLVTPDRLRMSSVSAAGDAACLRCHPEDDLAEVTVSRGVRMSHTGLSEGGFACVDCHEGIAHGTPEGKLPVPTMGMCVGCHDGQRIVDTCETCHPERTDSEVRLRDAEWAKTHGPDWRQTHGMGDLATCGACHTPEKCEGCHGVGLPHPADFGITHGPTAVEVGRQECETCHTLSFCESCHGIEMPHPQGFLQAHTGIAESRTDESCMRCHVSANCNECHERHTHPGVKQRQREPQNMYEAAPQ